MLTLGYWLNQIAPENKKDACKEVGINYDTANVYANTCSKIPLLRRQSILSFTVYASVCTAKLDDEQRTLLLENAAKEQWTTKYLRNQIKLVQNDGKPDHQPPTTRHHPHKFTNPTISTSPANHLQNLRYGQIQP